MIKHIFIGISCILVISLQVAFLSNYSLFRNHINIYILVLVCLMLALRFRQFLVWVVLFGLGLDVYSGLGFGVITISLLAAAVIAYLLYLNFFSHQTNVSLILLTGTMVLAYNLFLSIVSLIFFTVGFSWVYVPIDVSWLSQLGFQLFGTCVSFIALYVVFHPTIERFRKQFMIRKT